MTSTNCLSPKMGLIRCFPNTPHRYGWDLLLRKCSWSCDSFSCSSNVPGLFLQKPILLLRRQFGNNIPSSYESNSELPKPFPDLGILEIVDLVSIPMKTIGVLVCFGTNFKRSHTGPNFFCKQVQLVNDDAENKCVRSCTEMLDVVHIKATYKLSTF